MNPMMMQPPGGMGTPPMGVPPNNPLGMPQGSPTAQPDANMLIEMLMGGAMQGMSQVATSPTTLLQALMAQQGPAPMQPPPMTAPMSPMM